MAKKKA